LRHYSSGFNWGDVTLPKLPEPKPDLIIRCNDVYYMRKTKVAMSLGCNVQGSCLPFANPHCNMNIIQGIIKRFGCAVPQFAMCYYDRVHCFVHDFIVSHFEPIPLDADVSVSTWLASCKYPLWRKNELLNCDWDGTFINKSHV
jgi:hypothetical protein